MLSLFLDEKMWHEWFVIVFLPLGRTDGGGSTDKGAWRDVPKKHEQVWQRELQAGFAQIKHRHPSLGKGNTHNHLGTLGTNRGREKGL
jgi:hypothetical protein